MLRNTSTPQTILHASAHCVAYIAISLHRLNRHHLNFSCHLFWDLRHMSWWSDQTQSVYRSDSILFHCRQSIDQTHLVRLLCCDYTRRPVGPTPELLTVRRTALRKKKSYVIYLTTSTFYSDGRDLAAWKVIHFPRKLLIRPKIRTWIIRLTPPTST